MSVVPSKIAKRIKRKILKKIQGIIDGYTVVHSEEDGCDKYGSLYWVDCQNGFWGRSYDIGPAQTLSINKFKKNIVENGILYADNMYFVDEEFYFKIGKDYKIKFISKETHHTSYKESMNSYQDINMREIAISSDYLEKNKDSFSNDMYCYNYRKIEKKKRQISQALTTSKDSYEKTINTLV